VQTCGEHATGICIRHSEIFGNVPKVSEHQFCNCVTAIVWRKKSFRKSFEKEENFMKIHLLFARVLEAPAEDIASLIQDEIVLTDVKEMRARCSASSVSMLRASLQTKISGSSLLSSRSFALLVEKSVWLEPESRVSLCLPRDLSRFSRGKGVAPFGN
jgi:hypothetical protein